MNESSVSSDVSLNLKTVLSFSVGKQKETLLLVPSSFMSTACEADPNYYRGMFHPW